MNAHVEKYLIYQINQVHDYIGAICRDIKTPTAVFRANMDFAKNKRNFLEWKLNIERAQ